jgi:hypothetical protein
MSGNPTYREIPYSGTRSKIAAIFVMRTVDIFVKQIEL